TERQVSVKRMEAFDNSVARKSGKRVGGDAPDNTREPFASGARFSPIERVSITDAAANEVLNRAPEATRGDVKAALLEVSTHPNIKDSKSVAIGDIVDAWVPAARLRAFSRAKGPPEEHCGGPAASRYVL